MRHDCYLSFNAGETEIVLSIYQKTGDGNYGFHCDVRAGHQKSYSLKGLSFTEVHDRFLAALWASIPNWASPETKIATMDREVSRALIALGSSVAGGISPTQLGSVSKEVNA